MTLLAAALFATGAVLAVTAADAVPTKRGRLALGLVLMCLAAVLWPRV